MFLPEMKTMRRSQIFKCQMRILISLRINPYYQIVQFPLLVVPDNSLELLDVDREYKFSHSDHVLAVFLVYAFILFEFWVRYCVLSILDWDKFIDCCFLLDSISLYFS